MLKRKIYEKIEDFYRSEPQKAMMITGARQVGKSYIIEQFAKTFYKHFIKIDFIAQPELIRIFEGAKSAEEMLLRMSVVYGREMVPHETMIFFDEVQECKETVTQIKYLLQEGSYQYILSGSLLGTVFKDILSVPVGYLEIVRMFPLDLEEFAWANGIEDSVLRILKEAFENRRPVDDFVHTRMMDLFNLYLLIGGMPAAVQCFIETGNLRLVADTEKAIVRLYKKDISKYDREEKLYLDEIFDLIPSELNAKNKRFILKNLNENAKFVKYNNSFLWLKNAGVALPAYVADEPKAPLLLSKSSNLFKLFSNDVGLLAAQYGAEIQLKIINRDADINFGAVYENVAATELAAHGYPLYFYNSKKFGELDFMIEDGNRIIPIEIKSGKDYTRHNALSNVLANEEYHIPEGLVFCNDNVSQKGKVLYLPIYMLMFVVKPELPDDLIIRTDFSDLNAMGR